MNTTDDHTTPSPRERAAWDVRTDIRLIARDAFGATWTETPIEGFRALTRAGLDDPLAGVRAAVLARNVAAGQMLDYAEAARGAGRTWDDIAHALGIDPERHDGPVGELAFGLLVEDRALPRHEPDLWHEPTARWTCTTCSQRVTDRGPYSAHPDDVESGHAPDCARHTADLAAYRAGWDDDLNDDTPAAVHDDADDRDDTDGEVAW